MLRALRRARPPAARSAARGPASSAVWLSISKTPSDVRLEAEARGLARSGVAARCRSRARGSRPGASERTTMRTVLALVDHDPLHAALGRPAAQHDLLGRRRRGRLGGGGGGPVGLRGRVAPEPAWWPGRRPARCSSPGLMTTNATTATRAATAISPDLVLLDMRCLLLDVRAARWPRAGPQRRGRGGARPARCSASAPARWRWARGSSQAPARFAPAPARGARPRAAATTAARAPVEPERHQRARGQRQRVRPPSRRRP